MGISGVIMLLFLAAVATLIMGFVKKSRALKLTSVLIFASSIGLAIVVWNALAYM